MRPKKWTKNPWKKKSEQKIKIMEWIMHRASDGVFPMKPESMTNFKCNTHQMIWMQWTKPQIRYICCWFRRRKKKQHKITPSMKMKLNRWFEPNLACLKKSLPVCQYIVYSMFDRTKSYWKTHLLLFLAIKQKSARRLWQRISIAVLWFRIDAHLLMQFVHAICYGWAEYIRTGAFASVDRDQQRNKNCSFVFFLFLCIHCIRFLHISTNGVVRPTSMTIWLWAHSATTNAQIAVCSNFQKKKKNLLRTIELKTSFPVDHGVQLIKSIRLLWFR